MVKHNNETNFGTPAGLQQATEITTLHINQFKTCDWVNDPPMLMAMTAAVATPEKSRGATVLIDGEPVGHGFISKRENYGYIWMVGVHPDKRGEGVGTAIMEFLHDVANEWGLPYTQLAVGKTNTIALSLYRTLGYFEVGEEVVSWPELQEDGTWGEHSELCWVMNRTV